MRLRSGSVALVLSVAVSISVPAVAWACSCLSDPISQSDPLQGASDVPLNQAIVIRGHLDAASIELEDADGTAVPFELNHGPLELGCSSTWAELIPRQPLAAMTQYTVRARSYGISQPNDRAFVTFTTGAGLLPDETLSKPRGRASLLERITLAGDTCAATRIKACVGLEEGGDIELIARHGDDIILRVPLPRLEAEFSFKVVPDCLEFRRRARTGQRSEPLTLCGEELSVSEFPETEVEGYIPVCRGGVYSAPEGVHSAPDADQNPMPNDEPDADESDIPPTRRSDGCSLSPTLTRSSSAPVLMWLSSLALARVRRRR